MQPLTLAITPPVSSHAPWHLGQASRHFQEPCHESQSQQQQGFQVMAWLLPWLHSKTTPTAHDQQAAASGRSIKPHRQHSKTTLTASRSPDASHWMRRLTLPPAGGLANATTASPSVSRPSLGRHVPCPLHRCSSPSPRHGAQKCPLFPALLLDNI